MKLAAVFLIPFFIYSISICQAHPKKVKNGNAVSKYDLMNGADIKGMVQVQIDSARARDYRGEIKSCMFISSGIDNMDYLNNKDVALGSEPFVNINPKIYIIVGFSILVFLFVFIKRMLSHRTASANKKEVLDSNPVMAEEILKNNSTGLEQIRNQLNPAVPEIKEVSISKQSNGVKQAQGEMILAAKIKSYQLAHFGNK